MKKPLLFAAISLTAILLLGGCGGGGSTAAQVGASSDLVGSSDLGGGLSSPDVQHRTTSGVVWRQKQGKAPL